MSVQQQKASLANVQNIIAAGNRKIAALDLGLKPDVRRDRVAAIRLEFIGEMAATRHEMRTRGVSARAEAPRFSQETVRRKAVAHVSVATFEMLRRIRTGELKKHLADAMEEKSIGKAEAVKLEFNNRPDREQYALEFAELFATVVDQDAMKAEADLNQIAGLSDHAETLIHEFARGVSNPMERITTARLAGASRMTGSRRWWVCLSQHPLQNRRGRTHGVERRQPGVGPIRPRRARRHQGTING